MKTLHPKLHPTSLTLPRRSFLATLPWLGFLARAAEKRTSFRAGAAMTDITLPLGAANGGVIAKGSPTSQIHDPLHARCLVLADGNTQLALVVCDLRMMDHNLIEQARNRACEATGIPQEMVLISATHTHGAPGVVGLHQAPVDLWYRDFLVRRISDAIRQAHARLAPARAGWGTGTVDSQTFNRRWFMKEGTIPANPFGTRTDQVQMNPPRASANLVRPAGPADPELSLLSIQHEDGRPLAMVANFGMHYVGGYQGGQVSADYFGLFAKKMESLLGAESMDPPFVAMLSNGASGDTNNINFREPGQKAKPWERMREVADVVAREALAIHSRINHRTDVSLDGAVEDIELGVRKPDAARLEWARSTLKQSEEKKFKGSGRTLTYAREALELDRFPDRVPVRLQALRIGQLTIAAAPCEVFAETGLAIKAGTPGTQTFLVELANGYNGYLPTPKQHEWGGYETWPARSAYLEVGAEPRIRATLLKLIGIIHSK